MPATGRAVQLTLDLPHAPALGRADFLPSPCNAEAHHWIARWPDWPGPVLLLEGPPGCGKTHLAGIWAERAHAVRLSADALRDDEDPLVLLAGARACLVEDVHRLKAERTVFHLYNLVTQRQGHMLVTLRRAVRAWRPGLPDLDSRLRAAFRVRIAPPDDALLGAVLVKQFHDRQINIDQGVVTYLMLHMERSFQAVQAAVAALDATSLRTGRPITLAMARGVLQDLSEHAASVQDG